MRLLFVVMAESIHTARWVSQITDQGWDIRIFPVARTPLHPVVTGVRYYNPDALMFRDRRNIRFISWISPAFYRDWIFSRFQKKENIAWRARALARVIKDFKPDLIHSLEIQHAGYLTLAAREHVQRNFPKWWVTNWGSDIYLFARLAEHRERIKSILASSAYYSCECERDVEIAAALGMRSKVLPVFPNTGGFDLEQLERIERVTPTSARNLIMLKGYQHWSGRALAGLRALARCADLLKNYEVCVFSASPEVAIAAELFEQETGIKTKIIPPSPHEAMLKLYGRARLYIGLGISDGISTSMLEALTMGAYPIQSGTACANEWITHGESGFIVPPEDPDVIAEYIRRALTEDLLVDEAALLNQRTARARLDCNIIKPQVINIYKDILSGKL